jgi:phage terminase large subunit
LNVSGGGAAWNVIWFRRGFDARSKVAVRITGEAGRDRSVLIGVLAEILADQRPEHRVAAMFVDSAFGSPIVERLRVLGYQNVHEITFGAPSPDQHQANMRAYMWNRMKEWMLKGAIPDQERFASQLAAPGYHINSRSKLVIESKADMVKRGEASPDDADALALTLARTYLTHRAFYPIIYSWTQNLSFPLP